MKYLTAAIPSLVGFGPLAMVMGLTNDWLALSLGGALMTSFGMHGMFVLLQRAQRERETVEANRRAAHQGDAVDDAA